MNKLKLLHPNYKKMKKTLSILAIFGLLNLNALNLVAQDNVETATEQVADSSGTDSLT